MTIREITMQMLRNILVQMNVSNSITGKPIATYKQIAEMLKISPTALSRLATGATTPNVENWMKIIQLHRELKGDRETAILLDANINIL